jgi:hypothetical protein
MCVYVWGVLRKRGMILNNSLASIADFSKGKKKKTIEVDIGNTRVP